jgi:hypothetical protein
MSKRLVKEKTCETCELAQELECSEDWKSRKAIDPLPCAPRGRGSLTNWKAGLVEGTAGVWPFGTEPALELFLRRIEQAYRGGYDRICSEGVCGAIQGAEGDFDPNLPDLLPTERDRDDSVLLEDESTLEFWHFGLSHCDKVNLAIRWCREHGYLARVLDAPASMQLRFTERAWAALGMAVPCPRCNGRRLIEVPCPECCKEERDGTADC